MLTEHVAKDGTPTIVQECTLPLTGKKCVQRIITGLGVIGITERGPVLAETAPGVSVEEIRSRTAADLTVATPLAAVAAPDAVRNPR
jgi:3-oxoacid CoA-transferase subunit B